MSKSRQPPAPAEDLGRVPWPIAVSFLLRPLADSFSLREVYAVADPLRTAFPNNRHIEAKIRQSLQILRDRGRLAFDGAGRYRKRTPEVRRSVKLDFREAAHFTSRSQVARVAVEAWAATNVGCLRCESPLLLVPPNTKLLDAICLNQNHEIQIKAVSGISMNCITGGAFEPMRARLESGDLPDYLLVSYDTPRSVVVLAEYVDGSAIARERVAARPPLKKTARRAGWIGATIDLAGLPRRIVVGPSFEHDLES